MAATTVVPRSGVRERLIGMLADGGWHSGEQLAGSLGVSRTAVWKALNGMRTMGMEIERLPRHGYRWRQYEPVGSRPGLELLDADAIRKGLGAPSRQQLRNLDVVLQANSTNQSLLQVEDLPAGRSDACFAEYQSAGRGRRGREWIAPFGGSLCLSVNRLFTETPRQLSALSLAAGVAVMRALGRFEVAGAGLKWPNDLLLLGRKLGGILTELRAEAGGPVYVVVGLGLNLQLGAAARQRIRDSVDGPVHAIEAVALSEVLAEAAHIRNVLAAALVDELIAMLNEYQKSGFHTFADEWRRADVLAAAPVRVLVGENTHSGIARGIDEEGALLLETPGRLLRFNSGEISLRKGDAR